METNQEYKDLLDDLSAKYVKVRKLLDIRAEESLAASENILKRKNEAVDILKEIQIKLEDALNNKATGDAKLETMLAIVLLDIGIVCIDNEELKTGEENLTRCVEVLAGKEVSPEGILPALGALNQLGIVWFQWAEPNKAESFLKQSEKIYHQYFNSENKTKPVAMSLLFGVICDSEPDPDEVLDKLHTLTLYYLAQIYKDHRKAAKYCHMTLQRQLNHSDLDHVDWALNAATLSQFFMEKAAFSSARHHLAAASHILKKYEDSLGEPPAEGAQDTDEVLAAKWEQFRHRSADVARCWAKYGILLMSMSRDRLIELSESSESEKQAESESSLESTEKSNENFENMKFTDLEKELGPIAEIVTDQYLLDFNDAKSIFLNVQHWLDEAKKYYTFESHASDYVQIVSDISQAYKNLSFFEDDEDRQAKMHKRRINILETVVNELNPRYYQSECRQIWVELAETHSAILNIKLDRLKASDERPTAHALRKINSLAQSAIKYYQKFLDSLKESENAPPVQKFTEDTVRPALFAYFHLGTLYNKIITPDKKAQLDNVKKSIDAYKFFVDYCESNEELADFMKAELNVCKELVTLLPLKMTKLAQLIATQ